MEEKYVSLYEITEEMLELVAEIMENLGKLNRAKELERIEQKESVCS